MPRGTTCARGGLRACARLCVASFLPCQWQEGHTSRLRIQPGSVVSFGFFWRQHRKAHAAQRLPGLAAVSVRVRLCCVDGGVCGCTLHGIFVCATRHSDFSHFIFPGFAISLPTVQPSERRRREQRTLLCTDFLIYSRCSCSCSCCPPPRQDSTLLCRVLIFSFLVTSLPRRFPRLKNGSLRT